MDFFLHIYNGKVGFTAIWPFCNPENEANHQMFIERRRYDFMWNTKKYPYIRKLSAKFDIQVND